MTFGSKPRPALALALSLALSTACASTSPDDAAAGGAVSSGGTSSGGTSSTATSGTSSGGTSNTATGGTSSGGTSSNPAGGAADTDDPTADAGAPSERPYANVTAVATSGSDGAYTFNVTLESADLDCTQYADWWEVLSEQGALVYRRILEHSHTDANGSSDPGAPGNTFTRSGGPVAVAGSDVVLVRAHMSAGRYNGAVMRGSAASGFMAAPEVGADFAAEVEQDDPQPDGCEF